MRKKREAEDLGIYFIHTLPFILYIKFNESDFNFQI